MKSARILRLLLVVLGAAGFLIWPGVRAVWSQSSGAIYVHDSYPTYQFHTLHNPTGITASSVNGVFSLYISDSSNNVVRQFTGGQLLTLAGTGAPGYVDGPTTSAQFNYPTGLYGGTYQWLERYFDCSGGGTSTPTAGPCQLQVIHHLYTTLYVNDSKNVVVRKICAGDPPDTGECNASITNTVSTVAGNHTLGYVDGPSLSSEFGVLAGISRAPNGTYYIFDAGNNAIRTWDTSTATVATYSGTGQLGYFNGYRTNASYNVPISATWDSSGNMYVTDAGNNVIRKIDTAGNVGTFAGSGTAGYADGQGLSAQFNSPSGIAFNPADNYLYVADSGNNMIRRIDLSGNATTYTGAQTGGWADGFLSQARFASPMGVTILGGSMYISDAMNNAIRVIDMNAGVVSTYIS